MIKILYVHGYMGSGNGNASRLVRVALDRRGIAYRLDAPQFPVTEPDRMDEKLKELIPQYDYIVASSMGAFYAMQYSECFMILVNPALPENLRAIRDKETGQHPDLTEELLDRLEAEQKRFFDTTLGLFGDEYVFATYFVFGNRDDIAGNEAFFRRYYPLESHVFHADMGHIMEEAGAEKVVDIIERLEEEKPVYVDQLDSVMADLFRDSDE